MNTKSESENKFHAVSSEQASKDLDYMWTIANEIVRITAPLHVSVGWIARQNIGGYGFIIGDKSAYVSDDDLYSIDREKLVNRCAEKILGYPINSPQHISDLTAYWNKQLHDQIHERDAVIADINNIQNIINKLEQAGSEEE